MPSIWSTDCLRASILCLGYHPLMYEDLEDYKVDAAWFSPTMVGILIILPLLVGSFEKAEDLFLLGGE